MTQLTPHPQRVIKYLPNTWEWQVWLFWSSVTTTNIRGNKNPHVINVRVILYGHWTIKDVSDSDFSSFKSRINRHLVTIGSF